MKSIKVAFFLYSDVTSTPGGGGAVHQVEGVEMWGYRKVGE